MIEGGREGGGGAGERATERETDGKWKATERERERERGCPSASLCQVPMPAATFIFLFVCILELYVPRSYTYVDAHLCRVCNVVFPEEGNVAPVPYGGRRHGGHGH